VDGLHARASLDPEEHVELCTRVIGYVAHPVQDVLGLFAVDSLSSITPGPVLYPDAFDISG
jgi:hypothetical protein